MKAVQEDWILVIFDVENKHLNEIGGAALSLFYIWGTEVHLEFKPLLLQVDESSKQNKKNKCGGWDCYQMSFKGNANFRKKR